MELLAFSLAEMSPSLTHTLSFLFLRPRLLMRNFFKGGTVPISSLYLQHMLWPWRTVGTEWGLAWGMNEMNLFIVLYFFW